MTDKEVINQLGKRFDSLERRQTKHEEHCDERQRIIHKKIDANTTSIARIYTSVENLKGKVEKVLRQKDTRKAIYIGVAIATTAGVLTYFLTNLLGSFINGA